MTTTGHEDLTEALANVELHIKRIRSLKGFRTVAWGELAAELRRAADAIEKVAKEAKAWT